MRQLGELEKNIDGLLPLADIVAIGNDSAATIKQMQGFADPAPGQNPFVAIFAQKMEAAKISEARREALRSEAEKVVATEVYPAWKKGIATLESHRGRGYGDAVSRAALAHAATL